MARKELDFDLRHGRPRRSKSLNAIMISVLIGTFVTVPFVITRSIIYLEPEQALGILTLIGAVVVVLLPLHDRPVRTRLFFYMLLAYIVSYACWPNWLAIDLPFLPFVTPSRVVLLTLLFLWVFVVATSRQIHDRLWQRLKLCWPIIVALLVVLVFRGLAIPFSVDPSLATKSFLDQITSLYLPLMIAVTLIESKKDVELVLKVTVVVACIIGVFVIWEVATKVNPFVEHLGRFANYGGRWLDMIFSTHERNGKYRATGPFSVHLSMAEFYLLAIPCVLYWFETSKKFAMRVFLAGVVGLCLFVIYSTDSRTGMLTSGLIIALYCGLRGVLFVVRNENSDMRPIVLMLVIFLMSTLPVAFVLGLYHMGVKDTFGYNGTRFIQILMAIPKIKASPIIGYGSGLSGFVLGYRSNGIDLTIDNFYLSVVLDAGIPALIAVVAAFAGLIYVALRNTLRPGPDSGLYLAFFLYFVAFALVRTTLSEGDNLTLVHLMIGVFIAYHWISTNARLHPEAEALVPATEVAPQLQSPRRRRRARIWQLSKGLAGR